MRQLNYTKCAVICHGLSELQIARYIRSNLHLKLETFSRDSGHSSIQITSLMAFLNDRRFCKIKEFSENYDVEYSKKKLINFKLFIIMDTDDCTDEQKKLFMNKEMFKEHPLFEYIIPIANIPELESVLVKAGIMVRKIKNEEKGEYYFKTFPINSEPFTIDSFKEIEILRDKLENVENTNMDVFLNYCLGIVKSSIN